MKERPLMFSFMTGMVIDSALTVNALVQPGWIELNRYAREVVNMGSLDKVLIAKMALTAVMIGTYALATQIDSRWKMPIEKAMQVGNVLVWGTVAWNLINYAAEIVIK